MIVARYLKGLSRGEKQAEIAGNEYNNSKKKTPRLVAKVFQTFNGSLPAGGVEPRIRHWQQMQLRSPEALEDCMLESLLYARSVHWHH